MNEPYTTSLFPQTVNLSNTTNITNINTTSVSNTTAGDEIDYYYYYQEEQFAVLWFLFVSIVLGNTAVLVVLFLDKKRKSRMNFFIIQLALADLAVGLINVLSDIIWRITVAWYAGNILCKVIKFLQVLVTYSSTYVLVALSIDRYDAITHPMNFSSSWKRSKVLVIIAWGFSFLFSTPMLFLYEEMDKHGQTQCWLDFAEQWQWQLYMTLVSVALFVIPAIIISLCYTAIVYTIWSKSKLLTPVRKSSSKSKKKTFGPLTSYNNNEDDSRRASSRGLIPRAKIKTVKMTLVIVFVFILCWSPYIVFDMLQVYGYVNKTQTNIAIATFIQSLAPLNSAANPLIFCLFSTHVCRTLGKIPPFSWFGHSRETSESTCLRYGGETSTTLTETMTTSRRSGTSLRYVQVRIPSDSSPRQKYHLSQV